MRPSCIDLAASLHETQLHPPCKPLSMRPSCIHRAPFLHESQLHPPCKPLSMRPSCIHRAAFLHESQLHPPCKPLSMRPSCIHCAAFLHESQLNTIFLSLFNLLQVQLAQEISRRVLRKFLPPQPPNNSSHINGPVGHVADHTSGSTGQHVPR
jgi:hypothetical protein